MFNFFKTKPRKISQHELNQQLIDYLIKNGDNLEKEHLVELAFAGNMKKMGSLKNWLLNSGHTEVTGQTDKMLVVSKPMKLEIGGIDKITDEMEKMAKEFNAEFDGWSTYPVK